MPSLSLAEASVRPRQAKVRMHARLSGYVDTWNSDLPLTAMGPGERASVVVRKGRATARGGLKQSVCHTGRHTGSLCGPACLTLIIPELTSISLL